MLSLSGIRSRNDHEVRICLGLDRAPDPLKVDLQVYHILSFELPTSLREHLVLNVHTSGAGVLIELDCAPDIDRAAETCVRICNYGKMRVLHHHPPDIGELSLCQDGQIRFAGVGSSRAGACEIEEIKADSGGNPC
jgi:hypothetical protein